MGVLVGRGLRKKLTDKNFNSSSKTNTNIAKPFKWHEHQIAILVDNYKTKTDEEIGELIGKTKRQVKYKREYLKLKRGRKIK